MNILDKRNVVGMVAAIMLSLALMPVHAYAASGIVDIEMEASDPFSEKVGFGTEYDRTITISSLGEPCYVRLIPSLSLNGNELEGIYSDPTSKEWIHAQDGYWYFTRPLDTNESIIADSAFVLTGSEPSVKDLKTNDEAYLREVLIAEAIQAEGMEVDWSSFSPWEDAWSGVDTPATDSSNITNPANGGVAGEVFGDLVESGDPELYILFICVGSVISASALYLFGKEAAIRRRNRNAA